MNEQELAMVIAALRNWQADAVHSGSRGNMEAQFAEIFGDHAPLNDDEIDDLCEKLNQEVGR